MEQRKKPDVDVLLDILEACLAGFPGSSFVQSLHRQYLERGGLSKKQLEGLYGKAEKLHTLPASKLATLEARIRRMPNRYKSANPEPTPLYQKDNHAVQLVHDILGKYPEHKRVCFFRNKLENNEALTPAEKSELEKFHRLLTR